MSTYQYLVVLLGDGNYATLPRAFLIGLFDADVDHLWEVTVHLQRLWRQTQHVKVPQPIPSLRGHLAPHLLGSLLLSPLGALNAAVARDDDGDLVRREVGDLEALGVQGREEHLQAHQVLEFEVADRGLALAELLDEFVEAVADPLPGQDVVLLDLVSHANGQEGLVAGSIVQGK